jgi:hypothetical protein
MKDKVQDSLRQEPLDALDLDCLGIGSQYLVFKRRKEGESVVFKIDRWDLRAGFIDAVNDTDPDSRLNNNRKELAERRKAEKELEEFFGAEHLLRRHSVPVVIPMTKGIVMNLVNEREQEIMSMVPDGVYWVTVLAEVQPLAKELLEPEKYETFDINTWLMRGDRFYVDEPLPVVLEYCSAQIENYLSNQYKRRLEDPDVKRVISSLVDRMVQYTRATGRYIDIFGPTNVTIFKNDKGEYDYHLLDALVPWYKKTNEKRPLHDDNVGMRLRHAFVYFQTVNLLAEMCGNEERLKPEDLAYFKDTGIPVEWDFDPSKK